MRTLPSSYILAVSCWPARPDDQVAVLDTSVQNGDPDFAVRTLHTFLCRESVQEHRCDNAA